MIKIIDNVISKRFADEIELFCKNNLQWNYLKTTSYDDPIKQKAFIDSNTFDRGQFFCTLFNKEDSRFSHYFLNTLKPLIWTVQDKHPEMVINGIERIKVNMLLQQDNFPENHYNIPHHDSTEPNYSMLYYVNDSDGDTVFFNEFYGDDIKTLNVLQKVKPKKNTVVIFDSRRIHASSNPKITPERYVINFVLENAIE
jgi:hypothetical protein